MRNTSLKWIGMQLVALGIFVAAVPGSYAIPAFARKYGLPCSACHEAWPKLNNFGQHFRDNGYQLGNDKDSPIFQDPGYWPIAFRITPQWHRESKYPIGVDQIPGDGGSGVTPSTVTKSGFDLSAIDLLTGGTLNKNISFFSQAYLVDGSVFLGQMFVRFDNLLGSPWLNVKMGRFELDTLLSEERSLTMNNSGGAYYNYHFRPIGDRNVFGGIGDQPIGVELMGHSDNSYTRYSLVMANSSGGAAGIPTSSTYNVYGDFTQGFELPRMGLQRVGVYGYLGQSPTYFQTSGGSNIAGTGTGNRSFYRAGAYGLWYVGKFDFSTFYEHGQDNVFLGNGVAANQPSLLPLGAAAPTWNGGFVEAHYNLNPQFIFLSKYELVHMSRQANPANHGNFGDLDAWTVGYRWYPFMSPRAGMAWVQEFSHAVTKGTSGFGTDQSRNSLLMGFDFDF